MIRSFFQYCRDEIRPRWWPILASPDTVLAVVGGLALSRMDSTTAVARLPMDQVATTALTYSTIAFGFSLAGLTIALTLPDAGFVRSLATTRGRQGKNSFSNLLFVFSWTALVHWVLVVASIGLLAGYGRDVVLLPASGSRGARTCVGMFGGVVVYGLCQFVVTVLTLSQVGSLYIENLSKSRPPRERE
jgi:hypothetical protein